jgi:hypothetical protein
MADDIRAGDIVICVPVEQSDCPNIHLHLATQVRQGRATVLSDGRVYRVATLVGGGRDGIGAELVGLPSPSGFGFCLGRFRKLPTADAEFTEQMRALKPRVSTKQEA